MNILLWVLQGLLALGFLFLGGAKAFLPLATLKKNMPLTNDIPIAFTRFIGISELAGGIGLIIPALTGIQPWLTLAAAIGLLIVLVGALFVHIARHEYSRLGVPVVMLLLIAFVLLGRSMFSPL